MKTIVLLLSLVAAGNPLSYTRGPHRERTSFHWDSHEDLFGRRPTTRERTTEEPMTTPPPPTRPPTTTRRTTFHGDTLEDLFGRTTRERTTEEPMTTRGRPTPREKTTEEPMTTPPPPTRPPTTTRRTTFHGDTWEDIFGRTTRERTTEERTPPPTQPPTTRRTTIRHGELPDGGNDIITGEPSTEAERRIQMCRSNPLFSNCLTNMEFILMVERMDVKLFTPALDFARILLSITRAKRLPFSLLTFGQTDQALPCGWYSCTKKNHDKVFTELQALANNPPAVEVPRVAYAIKFGTEFPIAKRFGGQQSLQHILLMIGSGRQDPKEKVAEYVEAASKARRLGVTVLYLDIGDGADTSPRFKRGLEQGDEISPAVKSSVLKVIKVNPRELKDAAAVWNKVSDIVFPA